MNPADWRALLEALTERRIGADAFVRRFMEGWRANRDGRIGNPRPIEDLYFVVEAYQADEENRRVDSADEGELEEAARRALALMREDGAPAARTYDRARSREDIYRFQSPFRALAGLGCALALAWVGLCVLQIFAVADQLRTYLEWPAALATFIGIPLAFVPFAGNAVAFFGAVDVWHWPAWLAGLVFFAAPAATLFSAWRRWVRRPRA